MSELETDISFAEYDITKRFRVVAGSQSAHCCFKATVVDGSKPVIYHGKHYNNQYEAVCECFEREDAERIAEALNKL